MGKRSRKKKQRVPSLSDDLIVEILCRVPYRSLCRFKCVSRSWFALCSDPDIRKKSTQTLSGFFCFSNDHDDHFDDDDGGLRFLNISGRGRPLVDPRLPFLRGLGYIYIIFKQCCSGLLLCAAWKPSHGLSEADYVVCNPATQKWTVLPDTGEQHNLIHNFYLGFDPSVPSCFYVFMFLQGSFNRLKIYSSETGAWIFRQNEWSDSIKMNSDVEPVFFGGTLYAVTSCLSLVTVDTEGKTWRKINMLQYWSLLDSFMEVAPFITQSQGFLYATRIDHLDDNRLSVWQFKEDGNEQWTLKHSAKITRLLGRSNNGHNEFYQVIAAHPERNLIYLAGGMGNELMSYDLDNQEFRVICTLEKYFQALMLPYIPCFADWPLDGL